MYSISLNFSKNEHCFLTFGFYNPLVNELIKGFAQNCVLTH